MLCFCREVLLECDRRYFRRTLALRHGPKERVVRLVPNQALDVQGDFPKVIIAPHAGLAARDLRAFRDVVPGAGAVIDSVVQ
jgi:hypothetical protein